MRRTLTTLHRWFGLLSALFLFIAGATGAVISWDHELDAALNPRLYHSDHPSPALDADRALALASQLEAREPSLQVTWLPLGTEANEALQVSVDARIDPKTGVAHPLDYNQVALDPQTGETQGRREWGAVSLSRENLLPFLYKLHYTMHLPDGFGIEWGMWFMGLVAIVWVVDCFIALWISFPNRKVWRKSFKFRWSAGGHRLNYDLHRSGGVWAWLFLLVLAVTAVSMNLNNEVVRPIVSVFSKLTPTPFDTMQLSPPDKPMSPVVKREAVLAKARADAAKRGWTAPAGGIMYSERVGVYGVGFFTPENDHGDGTLGNPYLYYRGEDGAAIGDYVPGTGSAGDIFLQAQFPLHSGRLFGLTGRIIVSLLGAVVAMLSVTGVVIWARRKRARATANQRPARSGAPVHADTSATV